MIDSSLPGTVPQTAPRTVTYPPCQEACAPQSSDGSVFSFMKQTRLFLAPVFLKFV